MSFLAAFLGVDLGSGVTGGVSAEGAGEDARDIVSETFEPRDDGRCGRSVSGID
jgi:hypothetical protein